MKRRITMKILRLKVNGLALFDKDLDILFYGLQRINDEDRNIMKHLFANFYLNCTSAFIGKNASGKTIVLQLIHLALQILNNEPVNHISSNYVLLNSPKVTFSIFYFMENDGIYCLETTIVHDKTLNNKPDYKINQEKLYFKSFTSVKTKQQLTDIKSFDLIKERRENEEYLPDDISMIISQNKKTDEKLFVSSLLSFADTNELLINDNTSLEIIRFLDPTIESLVIETSNNRYLIHLKFFNGDKYTLNSINELEIYLSSGTIKGMLAFSKAKEVLKKGGYFLLDEIENHFNQEIVSTLIHLFLDSRVNKNGGVLIYTTHYPEILDEYERNDSIFITENVNGIKVTNLSKILKRNDIKKSEVYRSSMIAQTAPNYEDYMCMKKNISSYMNES